MPINSKNKGKVGEREAAMVMAAITGLTWRRTQQFRGCAAAADIELCDRPTPVHVEVKRDERLNVYEAMGQAMRDCAGLSTPCVLHRKNATPWLITFRADQLHQFLNAFNEILQAGRNHAATEKTATNAN